MKISECDYDLPAASIASYPLPDRAASRMLLLQKGRGFEDRWFREFPEVLRGDELVVVNNTRVIPARLFARRAGVRSERAAKTRRREHLSARIEVLLTRRLEPDVWEALVRPGRKVGTGERLKFEGAGLEAEVVGRGELGLRRLRFFGAPDTSAAIERIGHVPLPPYIRRSDEPVDRDRYQTIFASKPGAVAAPTAGLHFTAAILEQLRSRGIEICELTLEVGLGTFQPIHSENLEQHRMHAETYEIPERTAAAVAAARCARRPVLAVGTTVVRALEDAALKAEALGRPPAAIAPGRYVAELFIRPGHRFALVDQLLTNFHLPRSTLLILVSAFAGTEPVLAAYLHAVSAGYRFYSYGDCMLLR
jgi:S-adenosylmethionine:tRNA ribosyltransferase-isomerase